MQRTYAHVQKNTLFRNQPGLSVRPLWLLTSAQEEVGNVRKVKLRAAAMAVKV